MSVKFVRACLVAIAVILLLIVPTATATASKSLEIAVYRDPSCRCCAAWMEDLTAQGFQPQNIPTSDMDTLKQQYGVPAQLTSCHTAVIDGYVIEGHVPATDIKYLLAEHPAVTGIAVPGMPIGTPGMESGEVRESFAVSSFDQQGNNKVLKQYSFEADTPPVSQP